MALQPLPITATTTNTTASSRTASPLLFSLPAGGTVGLRRPSDQLALKSFSLPSVHRLLLSAGGPRVAAAAASASTLSTRVDSNQTHICRDCGYIYSGMTPFEKLHDKYFCPESSRTYYFPGIEKAFGRRKVLFVSTVGLLAGFIPHVLEGEKALASEFADMPALRGKDYGKTKMRYPDYTETESGLQYKDLRVGEGPTPKNGETVVVDWAGYTIGYYGRIFEARNKTKGGSFEGDDKDFFKFKLGLNQVIPAFEEAVAGMASGGIRRIVVPPELGYPDNDYNKLGPKPTTFSGQRALDFVLRNQGLIDKTLLFDIELVKTITN